MFVLKVTPNSDIPKSTMFTSVSWDSIGVLGIVELDDEQQMPNGIGRNFQRPIFVSAELNILT